MPYDIAQALTKGETTPCRFCRKPAHLISDTVKLRLYECLESNCMAVEAITKSDKAGWWYHGAQRPSGARITADGVRQQMNTYGWWDRL